MLLSVTWPPVLMWWRGITATAVSEKFNYEPATQALWTTRADWKKHRPGGNPAGSTHHTAHSPGRRPREMCFILLPVLPDNAASRTQSLLTLHLHVSPVLLRYKGMKVNIAKNFAL